MAIYVEKDTDIKGLFDGDVVDAVTKLDRLDRMQQLITEVRAALNRIRNCKLALAEAQKTLKDLLQTQIVEDTELTELLKDLK